jgi:hypothetical protein
MRQLGLWLGISLASIGGLVSACGTSSDAATAAAQSVAVTSSTTSGVGGAGGTGSGGGVGVGGGEALGGMGGTPCVDSLPATATIPDKLSATGLYANLASKQASLAARPFDPQFRLWSDGLAKVRWAYLPECATIDTSKMDEWQFPVGTRMWKEFRHNGKRLETRMIHRFGPGPTDFWFAAYLWNDRQTEAAHVPNGAAKVLGTTHDVPSEESCRRCHGQHVSGGGWPSRFLGFSAIQLSHNGPGVKLTTLINEKKLSVAPNGNFTVPGNATERAALGYLHANCGNCHNDTADGLFYPFFDMRLKTTDTDVMKTGVYTTGVNQPTNVAEGCTYRIAGKDPQGSCIHHRMNQRSTDPDKAGPMPPLGSAVVDTEGLAIVDAWIATLPPPSP